MYIFLISPAIDTFRAEFIIPHLIISTDITKSVLSTTFIVVHFSLP
jgi:hypothetical protein